MTLDELHLWHREQQERWEHLAEHNKANLPAVYKASLKRTYQTKADFHSRAVALLKSLRVAAAPELQND
ncbi:hypothetical protein PQQ75_25080 [Paraburkholderia aspalathi]|uniref:hypothetical protein n=1 Tax=Paraburkholderia aspalathi TaxID=1324617 RepID=UPI0038B966F4